LAVLFKDIRLLVKKKKEELAMRKESTFSPDWVVGILFINPDREICLVEEDNRLTLPTGHVDPEKDIDISGRQIDLQETIRREMTQEFQNLQRADISPKTTIYLGEVISQLPGKEIKYFKVFSCLLAEETAANLVYVGDKEERMSGHKRCIWVRPQEVISLENIPDGLAKEAVSKYLELFPEPKRQRGCYEEAGERNGFNDHKDLW